MAVSESATLITLPAGATFTSSDLYKGVVQTASGVVLPNTTGDVSSIGTLYEVANSTNTGHAAVVATAGVVKVRMAASTLAAGDAVGFSTAGLGQAPSTDAYRFGVIVDGSSGAVNRVVSVLVTHGGALNA